MSRGNYDFQLPLDRQDELGEVAQAFNTMAQHLKENFAKEGVAQFGSGWVWLVADDDDRIGIEKTPDAVTPMAEGKRCLLTIDVWEHAYYLDYQNRRADHVDAVIDRLLNWNFAEENFAKIL